MFKSTIEYLLLFGTGVIVKKFAYGGEKSTETFRAVFIVRFEKLYHTFVHYLLCKHLENEELRNKPDM